MSYKLLILLLVLQICIVDGVYIFASKIKSERDFKNRDPSPFYKCVETYCGRFINEKDEEWGPCMDECMTKIESRYVAEFKPAPFLV
ncbi:unnamed protein product [Cylicocyclus nassatus]|uniref:Uncharacterized protein n=1 Tax=Cylicocyclus nassatus TaxID=53992 RepID=A0AA36GDV4_CYLNA|nr:unnamed protein product [Cylicocyclus nassatus]